MNETHFSPMLIIPGGVMDLDFYSMAFGAVVLQEWKNDDGSIHVAELAIGGAMFHVHQDNRQKGTLSPADLKGVSTIIGLFVDDVDAVMERATAAGAKVLSSVTTYDYAYRQGTVMDPYGHHWQIQKKL